MGKYENVGISQGLVFFHILHIPFHILIHFTTPSLVPF